MRIYIGSDHRAHTFKRELIAKLQERGYEVVDSWDHPYDPEDDHPDAAKYVVEAMQKDTEPHIGVVMCGSGVGVSIAANRYKGIFCVLGYSVGQVTHARAWDHANVLAIGSEYTTLDQALEYIHIMTTTPLGQDPRMTRRVTKTDMMGL